MTRIWTEKLDPARHRKFPFVERAGYRGGYRVEAPRDPLITKWVYFVRVCSFTFQFHSLADIPQYIEFYSHKTQRSPQYWDSQRERYFLWNQRLPLWLREEPKRIKVVKALQQALNQFEKAEH